jgi:uncharacterized protein
VAHFGPHSDNPLVQPFWSAAREGRLVLPFDRQSGRVCWYPREDAATLDWREVDGAATLYAFTVVRGPLNPEYATPYAPALVTLAAAPGARLVTQIVDCDFAALACGMALELCFRELRPRQHAPFLAPVFRPITGDRK